MRKTFLLAAFIASLPLAANAQTIARDGVLVKQISVPGTCFVDIIPDRGTITMTAEALSSKDAKFAVDEATRVYEAVRGKVQKMNLKDVELTTTEYTVYPEYIWEKEKQIFKGYRARIGLQVQSSEIGKIGDVATLGANEGMKNIGALQMIVSRAKQKQAVQDCLADAALDARKNAERIAGALGVKLGDVLSFTQEGAAPPPMLPMARNFKAEAMMAADAGQIAGVEPGKQTVTLNVQASFEIK